MSVATQTSVVHPHPSASLVIDSADGSNDASELADIGHGGFPDEQPADSHVTYPPDPFEDLLSQYRSLEATVEEVRAENARLREMNALEAGRRDFLNAARRKFPTARVRTSIDVLFRPDGVEEFDLTGIVNMPGFCEVGIGVTWEEVSLKLSIKWQAHLAAKSPPPSTFAERIESIRRSLPTETDPVVRNMGQAMVDGYDRAKSPRYVVQRIPAGEGWLLYYVTDTAAGEPDNVVKSWCDDPRCSGRDARRLAEADATERNAEAAKSPRFTVEHGPGFGPDGSDLFNIVDATKDAPENVVDYRSDHPRMSGRLAKAQAEEMAAELNRDAAEVAGETPEVTFTHEVNERTGEIDWPREVYVTARRRAGALVLDVTDSDGAEILLTAAQEAAVEREAERRLAGEFVVPALATGGAA